MSKPVFSTLSTSDLILASASTTRARLLEDAGLGFCQYPVSIDEGAVRAAAISEAIPAQDIAVMLAEMKAAAAVQRLGRMGYAAGLVAAGGWRTTGKPRSPSPNRTPQSTGAPPHDCGSTRPASSHR